MNHLNGDELSIVQTCSKQIAYKRTIYTPPTPLHLMCTLNCRKICADQTKYGIERTYTLGRKKNSSLAALEASIERTEQVKPQKGNVYGRVQPYLLLT